MAAPGALPSVRVAVVNWNTATAALAAAHAYAISEGVDAAVTIIDNASLPPERERLEMATRGSTVGLLRSDVNRGYGAAANRVLLDASEEFVCVSNADLVPAPDMLARLVEVARRDATIGLAGPRLGGAGADYHARLPAGWTLPLRAFIGGFGHRTVAVLPGATVEVEQPAGACLLARTEIWRALGGFDEGYFLWFEDVDLARRSLAAGFRNVVVGDAVAHHQGAESFAKLDGRVRQAIRLSSLARYASRHHRRSAPVVRVAVALARPVRARRLRARRPDGRESAGSRPVR